MWCLPVPPQQCSKIGFDSKYIRLHIHIHVHLLACCITWYIHRFYFLRYHIDVLFFVFSEESAILAERTRQHREMRLKGNAELMDRVEELKLRLQTERERMQKDFEGQVHKNRMHQYINTPTYQYTNIPIHQYIITPIYQYTNKPGGVPVGGTRCFLTVSQ